MRALFAAAASAAFLGFACGGEEHNEPAVSPPVAATPPAPQETASAPPAAPAVDVGAADAAASAQPASPPVSPITAQFVDLSKTPTPVKVDPCTEVTVSIASGEGSALGEKLKSGDTLVAGGAGGFDLTGKGLALIGTYKPPGAPCSNAAASVSKKVVRAKAAPELSWAKGTFKAHLDLDGAPDLYLGRLESTAAVPEHGHDTSWEVLCAVQASGTFTLEGTPQHLGPRGIVSVAPGAKHSWQPDPGSKLVAFQFYSPPGPEQRFKKLAADAKDAGAQDATK